MVCVTGGRAVTGNMKSEKQRGEDRGEASREGRGIAAICAAPSVLGSLGLLKGKTATCYPGYEEQLDGASCSQAGVITDGNITTARGLGYALDLGIELVRLFSGSEHAAKGKRAIQYER